MHVVTEASVAIRAVVVSVGRSQNAIQHHLGTFVDAAQFCLVSGPKTQILVSSPGFYLFHTWNVKIRWNVRSSLSGLHGAHSCGSVSVRLFDAIRIRILIPFLNYVSRL
jgi:hypothetical protein